MTLFGGNYRMYLLKHKIICFGVLVNNCLYLYYLALKGECVVSAFSAGLRQMKKIYPYLQCILYNHKLH